MDWPQYPWMMVLDTDGGQSTMEKPPGMDYLCPTRRLRPEEGGEEEAEASGSFYNSFSLANSVMWNRDRGARCLWWQGQAHKIPL